ncbi:MAG TPA: thiolase family protein [Gemmataceae bacterium]|nr:thiolase family protein [Gemmataceae bacterium]
MLDIAIVEGVRTPFVKAFGPLADIPAHELGRRVTKVVLERADLRPDQVDQVVFGNVATPPDAANIARVIALRAGIPLDRIAHTVHRNCASGMEAITTAAQLVQLGEARTVVAGGAESMSQVPLLFSHEAARLFLQLSRARGLGPRLWTLLRFRPQHFRPVSGLRLGLTDPVCALTMGETAEVLAEEFGISREEQDAYALESHRRAAAAQERYVLDEEITPLFLEETSQEIKEDIGPRKDQSLPALARLKPYFKKGGTVTVGNSCMVTDGAAAVVVMPGEAARAEGRIPLGYLRAYAYAGCDPRRMGLGPAFATSKLLKRTGLGLKDFDLIELNEAFAAQVIANERAFASDHFAQQELGRPSALGVLDRGRLNVNGGAIALGHPISATGTRLVITLLKELRRRGLKRGLATLCVGGGQGAALLLETP